MQATKTHPVHRSSAGLVLRSGFTVVELLVVVVIILIVLTIATPAFRALLYSSNRSQAANSVNAAALAARELALRSASGDDGAVVFVYDRNGSMRIIPAIRVGTVLEPVNGASNPNALNSTAMVRRDVFAPVPQVATFELPTFWNVRGYAPARSMVEFVPGPSPIQDWAIWYNSPAYGGTNVNAEAKNEGNWVFPETAFYDVDLQAAGPNSPTMRQSFMIRFDARTGGVSTNRDPALFIDPRPSTANRPGGDRPKATDRWLRPDRAENLASWASGLLAAPPIDSRGQPLRPPYTSNADSVRLSYIGMSSNDTILVKPVTRVAVYDERRLARAMGARRLNGETNSLYMPVEPGSGGGQIRIDESLFSGGVDANQIREKINQWIEGNTNFDQQIDENDEPEARIYLLRPGTGELAEVLR